MCSLARNLDWFLGLADMNSCFDWIESNGERADWVDVFLVFLRPLLRLRRLLLGSSRTLAKLPRGKIYILKVRFVKICEIHETCVWGRCKSVHLSKHLKCHSAFPVFDIFGSDIRHACCFPQTPHYFGSIILWPPFKNRQNWDILLTENKLSANGIRQSCDNQFCSDTYL